MADYRDRNRGDLRLVSPNGDIFEGTGDGRVRIAWRGDTRSGSKRLAIHSYANVPGNVVRDFGSNSIGWTITAHFTGPDNDIMAEKFGDALYSQNGEWIVTHPTYGDRGYNLTSWVERIEPVESGNVTVFETVWIEGIDPSTLQTTAQMTDSIGVRADLVDVAAADQFVANTSIANSGDEFSLITALDNVATAADKILGPIAAQNTAIAAEFNAVQNGINRVLSSTIGSTLQIAGQFQALIKLPLRAIDSVGSRLDAYLEMADAMTGITPVEKNARGKNVSSAQELALCSVISANARIAATGPTNDTIVPTIGGMRTRTEVVNTAKKLDVRFRDMVATMDVAQSFFEDTSIEKQFFSQSQTFGAADVMTMQATQYLLASSMELKREKRFALPYNSTAVQEAVRQYGKSDNDEFIDFFIESNDLHGLDVTLMKAGHEVVVYV